MRGKVFAIDARASYGMSQSVRWHPLPHAFRVAAATNAGAVLLESAQEDRYAPKSRLFLRPVRQMVAWSVDELDETMREVDLCVENGLFVAGYFAYECGERFVGLERVENQGKWREPLVWLGVYERPVEFDHRTGGICGELPECLGDAPGAVESVPLITHGLRVPHDEYLARIKRVQDYLAAGHTYQVNFTDEVTGVLLADPLAVYSTLLAQQPVAFAAYVNCPAGPVLSFSPELFYRAEQGIVTVRPMKGTWPRGVDLQSDAEAALQLRNDEKNLGEHITIVDLLRNDVGSVCELGSVQVEKLLDVERYATLLQMTSTITGRLRGDVSASEVFRRLFPSGSITGAPKRRTMEIIREVEQRRRGVYTGAIGYFAPGDEACFNVAIRTMHVRDREFVMGVGGGITADSRADDEFRECELKAAFLTAKRDPFSLIETMKCSRGIALLELHLERLARSAAYFGIAYDDNALRKDLEDAVTRCGTEESKIRMELDQQGRWKVAVSRLDAAGWKGEVLLASTRTRSTDVFLHHKTTHRSFYEEQFATARRVGADEVLFQNELGDVTEGAISNVLLEIDGRTVTPALYCGVLSGVKRAQILEQNGAVIERSVGLDELRRADAIWMCNALRGVRAVRVVKDEAGAVLWRAAQVWKFGESKKVHPITE